MQSSLFEFTVALNPALEFLLGTSETLICSVSALLVKIIPLLDVRRLLMFVGDIDVLEEKLCLLIIF
jgi:hypothetical protein